MREAYLGRGCERDKTEAVRSPRRFFVLNDALDNCSKERIEAAQRLFGRRLGGHYDD